MNKVYNMLKGCLRINSLNVARKYSQFSIRNHKKCGTILVALGLSGAVACYKIRHHEVLATGQPMTPPLTHLENLDKNPGDAKNKMKLLALKIQADVQRSLEEISAHEDERNKFTVKHSPDEDVVTCYSEDGFVVEKAMLEVVAKENDGRACVRVLVSIYPKNPNIPSLQFDISYEEEILESGSRPRLEGSTRPVEGSFSGRVHLLPYVYNEQVFSSYHKTLKDICNRYNKDYYRKFKSLADAKTTFNGQAIGIGGISFPDDTTPGTELSLSFVEALADVFPLYFGFIRDHKDDPYTVDDWQYQLTERGYQAYHSIVLENAKAMNDRDLNNFSNHLPPFTKWPIEKLHVKQKQKELVDVLKRPRDWA